MNKTTMQSLSPGDLTTRLQRVKVKPSTMLLALGAALLLAYIVVGVSYVRLRQQQTDLQTQIEAAGGTLSQVSGMPESLSGLQQRLALLNSDLDRLQKALPAQIDSAAIVQTLVDDATHNGVIIKQMSSAPPTEVKAPKGEDPSYTALKYTLVIQAGMPHILSFLSAVENESSQVAEIGETNASIEDGQTQMTVSIFFYARPPVGADPTPAAKSPTNKG